MMRTTRLLGNQPLAADPARKTPGQRAKGSTTGAQGGRLTLSEDTTGTLRMLLCLNTRLLDAVAGAPGLIPHMADRGA